MQHLVSRQFYAWQVSYPWNADISNDARTSDSADWQCPQLTQQTAFLCEFKSRIKTRWGLRWQGFEKGGDSSLLWWCGGSSAAAWDMCLIFQLEGGTEKGPANDHRVFAHTISPADWLQNLNLSYNSDAQTHRSISRIRNIVNFVRYAPGIIWRKMGIILYAKLRTGCHFLRSQ